MIRDASRRPSMSAYPALVMLFLMPSSATSLQLSSPKSEPLQSSRSPLTFDSPSSPDRGRTQASTPPPTPDIREDFPDWLSPGLLRFMAGPAIVPGYYRSGDEEVGQRHAHGFRFLAI